MVNSSNKMNHNQRQTGYTSVVDCNMTKKKKKKTDYCMENICAYLYSIVTL